MYANTLLVIPWYIFQSRTDPKHLDKQKKKGGTNPYMYMQSSKSETTGEDFSLHHQIRFWITLFITLSMTFPYLLFIHPQKARGDSLLLPLLLPVC